jgi:hypothetical protein
MGQPGDWGQDPWWIKRDNQPRSVAAQLRTLAQRTDGTVTWRASVPAPDRYRIRNLVYEAAELLTDLHHDDTGQVADATRHLLQTLTRSAALLDQAVLEIAAAALEAGIPCKTSGTGAAAEDLHIGLSACQAPRQRR